MNKFFLLAVCAAALCSCSKIRFEKTDITIIRADGSLKTLNVELALTPEQHARGFMDRKRIPDGTGMLFVFERDQILSFWMKNTPSPLSIAYIDSSGVLRDVTDLRPPFSQDSVQSTVSVRYALEVPKGWFKRADIAAGDRLILPDSVLKSLKK